MKTKLATKTAQHGDLCLRKLDGILPTAEFKMISKHRCVLAEGEVTGHAHIVEDDEAELIQQGERILLRLGRSATVRHEEHKPITLSPGIWEIGRVKEYDYLSKMVRNVAD